MDERERRVGENEALFRKVNERLEQLNETFGFLTNRMEVVCECGNASCAQRLTVPVAEYEALRARGDQFIVAPGHGDPTDLEEVVSQSDEWEVVRKRPGAPAGLARQTDPRS